MGRKWRQGRDDADEAALVQTFTLSKADPILRLLLVEQDSAPEEAVTK